MHGSAISVLQRGFVEHTLSPCFAGRLGIALGILQRTHVTAAVSILPMFAGDLCTTTLPAVGILRSVCIAQRTPVGIAIGIFPMFALYAGAMASCIVRLLLAVRIPQRAGIGITVSIFPMLARHCRAMAMLLILALRSVRIAHRTSVAGTVGIFPVSPVAGMSRLDHMALVLTETGFAEGTQICRAVICPTVIASAGTAPRVRGHRVERIAAIKLARHAIDVLLHRARDARIQLRGRRIPGTCLAGLATSIQISIAGLTALLLPLALALEHHTLAAMTAASATDRLRLFLLLARSRWPALVLRQIVLQVDDIQVAIENARRYAKRGQHAAEQVAFGTGHLSIRHHRVAGIEQDAQALLLVEYTGSCGKELRRAHLADIAQAGLEQSRRVTDHGIQATDLLFAHRAVGRHHVQQRYHQYFRRRQLVGPGSGVEIAQDRHPVLERDRVEVRLEAGFRMPERRYQSVEQFQLGGRQFAVGHQRIADIHQQTQSGLRIQQWRRVLQELIDTARLGVGNRGLQLAALAVRDIAIGRHHVQHSHHHRQVRCQAYVIRRDRAPAPAAALEGARQCPEQVR